MSRYFNRLFLALIVCALVISNIQFTSAQQFPAIPQYTSPAEYEKATGKKISIFSSEYKEVIKEALKSIEEKDSIKICLDGIYNNWDEVYRDISWLNKILISE